MKNLLIIVLTVLSSFVYAVVPTWEVTNVNNYQFTMNITASLWLDKVESTDTGDIVGLFYNDTCRGTATLTDVSTLQKHLSFLTVYSNQLEGEELEIRVYDASSDETYTLEKKIIFTSEGVIGSPDKAYVIDYPTLEMGTSIVSFSSLKQTTVSTINEEELLVYLRVADSTDLTKMAADFEISVGAQVFVGGVTIESGDILDYTDTVRFVVQAENPSISQEWVVVVVLDEANGIGDAYDLDYYIYPNPTSGLIQLGIESEWWLLNEVGSIVLSGKGKSVDLSELTSGVYYLQLDGVIKKVVKD